MRKSQPFRSARQTELICKSPANAASRMHLAGEIGRGERGKSTDKAVEREKAPTAGGKKHRQGSGEKHLLIISQGRWMSGLAVRYRPCSSALIMQASNRRTQASTTPGVRQTSCATAWQPYRGNV